MKLIAAIILITGLNIQASEIGLLLSNFNDSNGDLWDYALMTENKILPLKLKSLSFNNENSHSKKQMKVLSRLVGEVIKIEGQISYQWENGEFSTDLRNDNQEIIQKVLFASQVEFFIEQEILTGTLKREYHNSPYRRFLYYILDKNNRKNLIYLPKMYADDFIKKLQNKEVTVTGIKSKILRDQFIVVNNLTIN